MNQAIPLSQAKSARRRWPAATLWLGLIIIGLCEVLLYIDVQRRGGVVVPSDQPIPDPVGTLGLTARYVAVNVTVFCWVGYLFLLDGILTTLARRRNDPAISSLRARPNRFVVAWLTSIPVWCFFDGLNFYLLDAWRYHGLSPLMADRVLGYFIAFAAITPGMLLTAQWCQHLGMARWTIRAPQRVQRAAWTMTAALPAAIAALTLLLLIQSDIAMGGIKGIVGSALLLLGPLVASLVRKARLLAVAFAVGVGFTAWALLMQDSLACMTLWVGLIYLIDPINAKLGAPSLLRDWQAGRWGRTLALAVSGATCGFCWELWNYWALTKWTYHLPFMGAAETYRFFEMPWLGFLGFLPFACECWVVLNLIIAILDRLHLRVAEALPNNTSVF
jgi:hypothetical protein